MIFNFDLPEELKQNSDFVNLFNAWDKKIKANYDCREKEVGDRVIVWDSSGSCDIDGKLHFESEEFYKEEMIIIENKVKYVVAVPYLGTIHKLKLDLILYSPHSGKFVRSHSDFCRIINRKSTVDPYVRFR